MFTLHVTDWGTRKGADKKGDDLEKGNTKDDSSEDMSIFVQKWRTSENDPLLSASEKSYSNNITRTNTQSNLKIVDMNEIQKNKSKNKDFKSKIKFTKVETRENTKKESKQNKTGYLTGKPITLEPNKQQFGLESLSILKYSTNTQSNNQTIPQLLIPSHMDFKKDSLISNSHQRSPKNELFQPINELTNTKLQTLIANELKIKQSNNQTSIKSIQSEPLKSAMKKPFNSPPSIQIKSVGYLKK